MSQLTLLLLGPPRIEINSAEVDLDTRKAVALVAYLAMAGQRQSRDTLAGLLWPEYSQANARATLRRTLSTLNKGLGGDHLVIDRETVDLQADNLLVDALLFKSLVDGCLHHGHSPSDVCRNCVAPLTEAVGLYRGHFMSGFALRDSPEFDDWQIYNAENLQRDLANALEKLACVEAARGDFEAAIEYARRWLSLDRLHEPAYRYLMLLDAWAGRRAAALLQYRECVRVLQQDLGVGPLEATTSLYNDIRENKIPPPPVLLEGSEPENQQAKPQVRTLEPATKPPERPPVQRVGMPMIGRKSEWSELVRSYLSISSGGCVLALSGEAGIGKTRLAEEFLAHANSLGAVTLTARCYEGESGLAYGPIAELLRAALRLPESDQRLTSMPAHWLSETARLLPEVAGTTPGLLAPPPLDSPGAQARFFEGLRQAFMALASGPAPGVLFFDDVQWADGASVEFLTYVSRRLRDMPVCLLLTWRTEEVPAGSSLSALLTEAQRRGEATHLALGRLSLAEVGELVRSTGVGEESGAQLLATRLYSETEGLPFFVVEYLTAMSRDTREPPRGEWQLPAGTPRVVRDLLVSRLRRVGEAGLQLLTTAAVIGRSFDFDTLQQTSGRSEEESVAALEQLLAAGLVIEVQGPKSALPGIPGGYSPRYDFSHEQLRNLVYEETSLARRRLLHRRTAEALVARARSPRDGGALAGQIAHHYRMAGNEDLAAENYRLAGEYARSLYANAEALAHFRTALALGHPQIAALHEAIGDLQTLLGEYVEALASYETAAALSEGLALAGIEHKLGTVHGRRGEWDRAESHLEAALLAYGEDGPTGKKSRVYADWSLVAYRNKDLAKALSLATRALQAAEGTGDVPALAQAHNVVGILASNRGDIKEAANNLEKSLSLARELGDPGAQAAPLNNLALVYNSAGDSRRAIEYARAALSLSIVQGDRPREGAIHSNLADLLHGAGFQEEAMQHLKQAVAIFADIGVEAGDVQPAIWRLTEL